jgi:hypothetical protein
MRIREGKISDRGWKKFRSGIQDKHPGSATLVSAIEIFLAQQRGTVTIMSS